MTQSTPSIRVVVGSGITTLEGLLFTAGAGGAVVLSIILRKSKVSRSRENPLLF